MFTSELKLSDLLDEIENRLRRIIREEVKAALWESKNPTSKIEYLVKRDTNKTEANKEFPTLLTAQQVAELLGISIQRVYELARKSQDYFCEIGLKV